MELHDLMSEDARKPVEKLRRVQLNKICRAYDIPVPTGATAEVMVALINSSGIDVTKPLPDGEALMQTVNIPTEEGGFKTEIVPTRKPHYTEGKEIDYDSLIEAKSQLADQKSENQELKDRISQLENLILSQHKDKQEKSVSDMSMGELRGLAKEKGVNSFGMKKQQLIETLSD